MGEVTGNLTERRPGVWQIRVGAGRDPASGRYRVARETVHGTREQAERARAILERTAPRRPVRPRPFPLQPLLEATGLQVGAVRSAVRASSSTMRIVATRGLTEDQADRWAVTLGLHPGTVWPSWWEAR